MQNHYSKLSKVINFLIVILHIRIHMQIRPPFDRVDQFDKHKGGEGRGRVGPTLFGSYVIDVTGVLLDRGVE